MTREQTLSEERVNAITHGIGVLASLVGGTILIVLLAFRGDPWRIAGSVVFGMTLITLYTASTLYHAVQKRTVKAGLKVFDHCAIFLLIAGTYAPFTLVGLRGPWGYTLLSVAWVLAVAGVIFKLFFTGRLPWVSTSLYLAMGWMVVAASRQMIRVLSPATLIWLLAGGLAYTAGIVFYHNKRMMYAHGVWHVFVLIGSTCHFIAVSLHLL